MAWNKVNFFKKNLTFLKRFVIIIQWKQNMIDKILQVVLKFFGKKKTEPPAEDNNESLEALERIEALDKIGEPK